ncbi:MAG: hypothetical protein AAF074_10090 [Pseudomonadota bacterium]
MRPAFFFGAALAVLAIVPQPAQSEVVGFDLIIDGGDLIEPGTVNVPFFTVRNISASLPITGFSLTIGDPSFNFDGITAITPPPGGSATIVTGDTGFYGFDGVHTDRISFALDGFDPGEEFRFAADIDADNGDVFQDFRNVLRRNGPAPNAVATITFADPFTEDLMLELRDGVRPQGGTLFSFRAVGNRGFGPLEPTIPAATSSASPVPVPAALPLFVTALAGLGFLSRARRRS